MNSVYISEKKRILALLSKRQIKEAFELLTKLSTYAQDWKISEKIGDLEMTYRYMLRYQFEGSIDPEREKVYNNILRTMYELTDDVADEILTIESQNIFYEKRRYENFHETKSITQYKKELINVYEELALVDLLDNGTDKQSRKRSLATTRERIASDMFNSVFVSQRMTQDVMDEYLLFLSDIIIPSREKSLFISALTLSLTHRFDARKLQILMTACQNETLAINQRAKVGLVIVLQMYDARLIFYPECQQQLDTLSEDVSFRKSILRIVKQIIRSRQTEKISRKMTEEIIPEMMRFSSIAKRKLNMEDILGDGDFSEKNPEWKKELEESGLANKLQEYSDLQLDGADVLHSTFANLKNFSFFNDLSNWFLPYDPAYSELLVMNADDSKDNMLYTAILSSGHMCNSDKYSFSLSLLQIPASQREMMVMQFGAESDDIKKMQKEAMDTNPNLNEEIVSNQYLQDLYRFFKLYRNRHSFFDVFTLSINFYNLKSIAPFISNVEDMKLIATYCFDKNFLPEAQNIYEKIVLLNESSDLWQKIGYCRQMQDDTLGALDAYLHADLLNHDNSWTIKRIAQAYKNMKQYDKAIEFYQKAIKLRPDDLSTELNIGHCYLELKEYDKALNSYFKIDMMDNKSSSKAWRPIAWTAFLMGRYELAEQYYTKILAEKATANDYLNAGHVQLVQNKLKEAISFYREAVYKDGENVDNFIALFQDDMDELLSMGLDNRTFAMIFDQLRYEFY